MQCFLRDVRSIHAAVLANTNGRGEAVLARLVNGEIHRINRARTVHGQLQVHSLVTGSWVVPVQVYQN